MASILIDSDVLIDFIRSIPNAVTHIQQLQANNDVLCTCDIVIAEVESGLSLAQSIAAQPFIDDLVLLGRDASAARQAGRWRYEYARKGISLGLSDVMIAATAHANHAGLLTRNLSHYPMRELTIVRGPSNQPRQ